MSPGTNGDSAAIDLCAAWLAASASSFVTGTILTVDGGFAAGTTLSLDE